MLNNMVGGMPGIKLLLQELLLLQFQEEETPVTELKPIVHGVSWLREPRSEQKADHGGAPPETDGWTCPRCRSHRCIRTNPGDPQDATFCCVICGYTFHGATATHLPNPAN
jgi:hypothetical protein